MPAVAIIVMEWSLRDRLCQRSRPRVGQERVRAGQECVRETVDQDEGRPGVGQEVLTVAHIATAVVKVDPVAASFAAADCPLDVTVGSEAQRFNCKVSTKWHHLLPNYSDVVLPATKR